jgi:hypothetical protein
MILSRTQKTGGDDEKLKLDRRRQEGKEGRANGNCCGRDKTSKVDGIDLELRPALQLRGTSRSAKDWETPLSRLTLAVGSHSRKPLEALER